MQAPPSDDIHDVDFLARSPAWYVAMMRHVHAAFALLMTLSALQACVGDDPVGSVDDAGTSGASTSSSGSPTASSSSSSSSSGDAAPVQDAAVECGDFTPNGPSRHCARFDNLEAGTERLGLADGGSQLQHVDGLGPLELAATSALFRVVANDAHSAPNLGLFKLDPDSAREVNARLVTYREQAFDRVTVDMQLRFVDALPGTPVSVLGFSLRCLSDCQNASAPGTFSLALSYDTGAGWTAYRMSTGADGGTVVAGALPPFGMGPKPDQWRHLSVIVGRDGFTVRVDDTRVFEIAPAELQIPGERLVGQTQVRTMVGLASYTSGSPGERPEVAAEVDDIVVDFSAPDR